MSAPLVPPDVLQALVRAIRTAMPWLCVGQVTVELNLHGGTVGSTYVNVRMKQFTINRKEAAS